jgi:multidrug efflux pump subunit AcrA (membrane-fusion protein)
MFASGTIEAGAQSVLLIPQNAVVYHENLPQVFVIGTDNKAHLRKIITGTAVGGKDIIVKEGLAAGDRVVTTGAGFLNDGDLVKPTAAQTGGEH